MRHRPVLALLMVLSLKAQEPAPAPKPVAPVASAPAAAAVRPLLDHDLLDPTYFGIDGALMKKSKVVDFLWVKPGFSFKGRTLKVTWEDPHWLYGNNDEADLEVAARFSKTTLPQGFSSAMATSLWPAAKVSLTEGDLILTGRIVMINARSSRWSFTKESMTFDWKVLDAATQEVVLACHHRFIVATGGNGRGKRGGDLEQRLPAFLLKFSEFCSSSLTN